MAAARSGSGERRKIDLTQIKPKTQTATQTEVAAEVNLSGRVLDFLIKHLRTIYTAQRRFAYLQHTGYTAVPVKFRRAEWERAVLFFVQHKLNFQRCVKARFDAERRKATSTFYVHPNSLASEKYLPLYQEAQLTLREEIEVEFETQKNICRDYLLVTAPA